MKISYFMGKKKKLKDNKKRKKKREEGQLGFFISKHMVLFIGVFNPLEFQQYKHLLFQPPPEQNKINRKFN